MAEVIVVATMKAGEGKGDQVMAALQEVAAHSHEEPGCMLYALHRSVDDPARIVMIERWASREDLDEHFKKPYVQAVGEQVHLLDGPPEIHFLEAVPGGDPAKGAM